MKKPLKIVSIDGTRGTGKSSQVRMLAAYLKKAGLKCSTLKAGDDAQNSLVSLQFIESFLAKGDDHVVILDGSIARPMVTELISGTPSASVVEHYRHVMHDYEKLNQKYGVCGILFIMDDIPEILKRYERYTELTGIVVQDLDLTKEHDIVSGMRTFNNHVASKNISFHAFNMQLDDSIMAIQKEVISYLHEKYDFPTPPRNQDDW